MRTGAMPGAAGSLMKLYGAETVIRRAEIGLELAGEDAVAWPADTETVGAKLGQHSLGRQGAASAAAPTRSSATSSASGCSGCPGRPPADRDIAYRDVRRSGNR